MSQNHRYSPSHCVIQPVVAGFNCGRQQIYKADIWLHSKSNITQGSARKVYEIYILQKEVIMNFRRHRWNEWIYYSTEPVVQISLVTVQVVQLYKNQEYHGYNHTVGIILLRLIQTQRF
jgi:hypothetical protein